MTQKEAAKLIGVEREGFCDWENHITEPAIEFYPTIIQFLEYVPFDFNADTLGGKVKQYRYLNGLSQENMSKQTGIGSATIMRLEHGIGVPSMKTMNMLQRVLET